MQIKIMDCTCGDGMAGLGWVLRKSATQDIISTIAMTNADIIEVGLLEQHLGDGETEDEKKQKMEISMENKESENIESGNIEEAEKESQEINEYSDIFVFKYQYIKESAYSLKRATSARFALTVRETDKYPISAFPKADKVSVSIIQIIIDTNKFSQSMRYCKEVMKKGFEVFVLLKDIHSLSDEKLHDMLKEINNLSPSAFYISDVYRDIERERFAYLWNIADKILAEYIAIGFYTNYAEKWDLSEIVSAISEDRQLILNTSICGIGTTTGGIHTELAMYETNEVCQNSLYNIEPIYDLYDRYFKVIDIFKTRKRALLLLIAKINKINPLYASYYGMDMEMSVGAFYTNRLAQITALNDSESFSRDKAEKCLDECNKKYWGKRLCIIICTANRDRVISYWLENQCKAIKKYGINLVIWDSSDDDKTESIVSQFIDKGYDTVCYERYTGAFNGLSIDEKVLTAYKKYAVEYEYVWAFRDGLVLNFYAFFENIDAILRKKPDLIVVNDYCRDILGLGNRYYESREKLFKDQCIQMTVLGGTIVRGDYLLDIMKEEPLDDEKNLGMWQPIAFFHYFFRHKVKAYSYVGAVFLPNPEAPVSSFWMKNMLWQWTERWYKMVTGLPSVYDPYKDEILKIEMSDFHPFSMIFLLKARMVKGVTFYKVLKYRRYIPYVCNTPLYKFFLASCVPGWLVTLLQKHKGGKLYHILKGLYIGLEEY